MRLRKGSVLSLLGMLMLLWCAPAYAANQVVTAEGKYVMGDLDSKKDARTLALMEAKRLALEKAGTYIESISEVKDYQLSKDQINSLATGVMSVEVLKEEWKMSGENMIAVISIRATVDTSNLKARVESLKEGQGSSESSKEIKDQIEALKKELADLKAKQVATNTKETSEPAVQKKYNDIVKNMSTLDHLEEGHAAMRVQRWNEAIEAYQRALETNPTLADAYGGIAMALQKKGQLVQARENADKALKINPKSAISNMAMASILFEQGKYGIALRYINIAIDDRPNSPRFLLLRGEIYVKLRNHESALRDFRKACNMKLVRACKRVDMVEKRIVGNRGPDDERRMRVGPKERRPNRPPLRMRND